MARLPLSTTVTAFCSSPPSRMADEQSLGRQPDIGFDAAKALIKCVQQGPGVLVVVVSMGSRKRFSRFSSERAGCPNGDCNSREQTCSRCPATDVYSRLSWTRF